MFDYNMKDEIDKAYRCYHMKKRVEQLVSGKFEYWAPGLILSEESIEVTISEGESCKGQFYFAAEDHSRIKGMLICDNRRILLSEDQFQGTTVHVTFGIDTNGLQADTEISTTIVILSNIGQVDLPVTFRVVKKQVQSSKGEIRTLADFLQLAREDYREAFRLFTGERFASLLTGQEARLTELYNGMSHNPVTYQNLEEFLIGAGEKEAVALSLEKQSAEFLKLEGSIKDTIYIYRSSWGYLRAEIETTGDFLSVEKRVLTDEDFIGSMYGLEYVILRNKLGKGKKTGKICLHTVYGDVEFKITASAAGDYEISSHRFERQTKYDLTKCYMDRCLRYIDYREWKENTLQTLTEMKNSGNYRLAEQLYETWLWLEDDNTTKAAAMLSMLAGREFSVEETAEEAAYLWLTSKTGVLTIDHLDYLERLRMLQRRNPQSIVILSILLREDEEMRNSPVKQLDLLEQQFELGVTSPILYFNALQLLRKDENLFRKLSDFVIQVLSYGARHHLLTRELSARAAHLAQHEKVFRTSIYRILCMAYEDYSEKDTLEAICRLIMLGEPGRKEYFKWYALAVDEDIRITRLYEYYIETMSRNHQGSLPKPVQLYFSYNNTLSSERKAFVYAKVVRRKEQDPKTYQLYEKVMSLFAWESLKKGKINEDFAVLYQEFIREIREKQQGEALAKVMFTHRLYSDDPKVRNVVVRYRGLKEEYIYPCRDGIALLDLYAKDAIILFEDAKQRRYAATVDYNLQSLMDVRDIAQQCVALGVSHPGLLLYICGEDPLQTEVTIRNLNCFSQISESECFEDAYRRLIRKKLLDYYDKNADSELVREYLGRLDYDEFYKADYLLLQDVLIRYDFCREAYTLIGKYGCEGMRVTDLFKLCHKMILALEFAEDEELLYLTHYVVANGKYDEVLLGYLRDNYIGSVAEMIDIWEKLRGFAMDPYALEEEILLVAMYTRKDHARLAKVLESYVKNRGRELVINAAFTFLAYGYFLNDIRIDMYVFKSLEHMYEANQPMDVMCRLALLKRYRFCKKLNPYQKRNVTQLVLELSKQGLRFAFYKDLPRALTVGSQLEDRVFVEQKFSPTAEVVLHYAIEKSDTQEEHVYKREPMKQSFHGIFVREFLLFYGEELTYYMTVTEGEKTFDTEEVVVKAAVPSVEGKTRYGMINRMLQLQEQGSQQDCLVLLSKYRHTETMTQTLFRIME